MCVCVFCVCKCVSAFESMHIHSCVLIYAYVHKDIQKTLPKTHLRREPTEEGKPEVAEGEGKVLVEEVLEELAHAQVGPAAVDQQ